MKTLKFLFLILFFIGITTATSAQAWPQIGQDIDGENANDNFGSSVSLNTDGSIVAIGAGGYDYYLFDWVYDVGCVNIYENQAGIWTQIGNRISPIFPEGALFGSSVSISADGSIVAIGAPYSYNNYIETTGFVSIYQNISGTWTGIGPIRNVDSNGDDLTDDLFGYSVSLSADGSIVAVGAPNFGLDDFTLQFYGFVKIYENISGTWTQIGSTIIGSTSYNNTGTSVSLSADGSIVAIGEPGSDANQVRIFENIFGTWTQIGLDIEAEALGDKCGTAVSISADGEIIAIGAPSNDGNGTDAGHVRVFENVSGTWTQIGDDIDGEASGDNFGSTVSLSNDGLHLAIGAKDNDGNGTDAGHVRIFENIAGIWTQIGGDTEGEAAGDFFGSSLSLINNGSTTVAVGAPANDENGSNAGHVRLFSSLPLTITSHPIEQLNICSGISVEFLITGDYISSWEWQHNDGSSWQTLSDDATYNGTSSNTLNVLTSFGLNNYQYRCIVSNPFSSETSDPATLSVIQSPLNFVPIDLAVNIPVNQNLSWDDTGALSYDIYLGEVGSMTFMGNQPGLIYDPILIYSTSYEWQIIPVTASGPAEGCKIWTFSTAEDTNPPDEGGISINDIGTVPNIYAVLDADISTHNKGILIPRLSTSQRTGIVGLSASEEGLTVYDKDTDCYWLWNGTEWKQFAMVINSKSKLVELKNIVEKNNKIIESVLSRINDLEKKKK